MKYLNNLEIYDLLIRIDDGYLITEDEKQVLNSIMSIRWEKINKLPNSMRLLSSLSSFEISNTEISDINALSNITSLSELNLSNTKVSDISALTKLTSLLELDLSNTAVSDISALSTLTSLKILNLRSTKVSDISTLSRLITMEKLDLYGLEINKLDPLSELKALKVLNLQNSKADAIPEDLLDLDIEFRTEENVYYTMLSYKGIFIHGLTLTDQPIEIFSQKRELIRAYYRERDRVPVNECKVIFLGDAESGKTYSIRRLLNNGEYIDDFDGESTPGIEITVNLAKLADTDIVINYWDFGGQEIQHSMHRVFLTVRTVYVVFLNARQDDLMDERARYWLENIKAFAPDAPVLVVINKIDQNEQPRFNEKGFIESYGDQVKKVIRLSAKKDEKQDFLNKLQGNINNTIIGLPTVSKRIPRSWKNLMESIREMSDHYLTTVQFIEKCQLNNIKNYEEIHDELVDLFQEIGVSFCYYKDRSVADYMLLNPKWMLNALYTIVTNGKTVAQNGVITQDNLYDLLEKDTLNGIVIRRVIPELRYRGFEVNYILGVIRMFGLSYKLKDDSEFFPMLCDGNEKISVNEVVPVDALHFIFRYTYLPTNVMHRLIVEMQRDLDYQYVWYTGAVFKNARQKQTAYIHSVGNDLHIYIYGEDKYYNLNEYLTPISNTVIDINKSMGLSFTELLTFSKNGVEAEIPFNEVIGNIRNGIYVIYNAKIDGTIKLDELARRYLDARPETNEILKLVVYALQVMQGNNKYYNCDENSRNRFVSGLLTAQLRGTGYTCADQQVGGVMGKAPGERDFVVKDEIGREILIYEGLNLTGLNRTRIDEHIDKLLVNYNPQGLRSGILVTYLECNRIKYNDFINNYSEHITNYAPDTYSCIGEPQGIPFDGEFLMCMEMEYGVGESYFTLYHIIVRIGQ